MAITPIRYNGKTYDPEALSAEDAKTLYKAHKQHQINLRPDQYQAVTSFLTKEDMESIDNVIYDTSQNNRNGENGAGMIGTLEDEYGNKTNAKDATNGKNEDAGLGAGGNAAVGGAVAGAGVAAVNAIIALNAKTNVAKAWSSVNGYIALIGAGIATACGAAAWAMSGRDYFDPGADVREQYKTKAGEYNSTMDTQKDQLEASVTQMEEDTKAYQEGNEQLTINMNQKALDIADLQQQIADAKASGKSNVSDLEKQLAELEKTNFDGELDELGETRNNLVDFQTYNDESLGLYDSGLLVKDFLQFGDKLKDPAQNAKTLLLVGAGIMALSAVNAMIPKIWIFGVPADGPSGWAAAALFAAGGGMMGKAALNYGNIASFENECGSAGTGMETHVGDLKTQIDEQGNKLNDTITSYDKNDEDAEKAREEGQENADKLNPENEEGYNGPVLKEEPVDAGTGGENA